MWGDIAALAALAGVLYLLVDRRTQRRVPPVSVRHALVDGIAAADRARVGEPDLQKEKEHYGYAWVRTLAMTRFSDPAMRACIRAVVDHFDGVCPGVPESWDGVRRDTWAALRRWDALDAARTGGELP